MALRIIVQTIFAFILSSFYSCVVILGFLFHPVRTFQGIMKRKPKRDTMPDCLNDAGLGNHGFIHLEDVRIHYVAAGDEGKPLMLLVHGFPEFWYSWRFQLREFSKDYRVVAIDQRGYGESDKPSGVKNYSTKKLTGDLKQLIPALGYRDCVLVGHDWGGAVVFNFANQYPEMVKKLIVMNAPHAACFAKYLQTNWKQFKKSWYMFLFQMPYLPEFLLSFGDYGALEQMLSGDNMKAEDVEAYKYAFSRPGGGFTAPINYYRCAMRTPLEKRMFNPIQVPTLIVWGENDIALSRELPELSKPYIVDVTIKYVQDATHFVQMDKPEAVNKIMREYLS